MSLFLNLGRKAFVPKRIPQSAIGEDLSASGSGGNGSGGGLQLASQQSLMSQHGRSPATYHPYSRGGENSSRDYVTSHRPRSTGPSQGDGQRGRHHSGAEGATDQLQPFDATISGAHQQQTPGGALLPGSSMFSNGRPGSAPGFPPLSGLPPHTTVTPLAGGDSRHGNSASTTPESQESSHSAGAAGRSLSVQAPPQIVPGSSHEIKTAAAVAAAQAASSPASNAAVAAAAAAAAACNGGEDMKNMSAMFAQRLQQAFIAQASMAQQVNISKSPLQKIAFIRPR